MTQRNLSLVEERGTTVENITWEYQYFQQDWKSNDFTVFPRRVTRYLFVENGEVTCKDPCTTAEALEQLWMRHNRDTRPNAHTFASMSVGDVVRLKLKGTAGFGTFRVADLGFEAVDLAGLPPLPYPASE